MAEGRLALWALEPLMIIVKETNGRCVRAGSMKCSRTGKRSGDLPTDRDCSAHLLSCPSIEVEA